MFELSVAGKYLIPRWRQLSVSLISLISIIVIALVVWLIVVFFSVTDGLEKTWTQKLIALTAPVKVMPTKEYYSSYFYHIDSLSAASGYSNKSIGDKLIATESDPYDPLVDVELPIVWSKPDLNADGSLKDPVKLAFAAIKDVKGVRDLTARDFENAMSQIRLRLIRKANEPGINSHYSQETQAFLTHQTFLGTLDPENPSLIKSLLPISNADITNTLRLLSVSGDNNQQDSPEENLLLAPKIFQDRLENFFQNVSITQLKTPSQGWNVPREFLPKNGEFKVIVLERANKPYEVILPQQIEKISNLMAQIERSGYSTSSVTLKITDGLLTIERANKEPIKLNQRVPIVIPEGIILPVKVDRTAFGMTKTADEIPFIADLIVQGTKLKGNISFGSLEVNQANFTTNYKETPKALPSWISHTPEGYQLPLDPIAGEGILLPKSFRDAGVLIGDRGYLSYTVPTASTLQEQRILTYVAGFYDPGIIPIGGKYILTSPSVTSIIRSSQMQEENPLSNGINIRFSDLSKTNSVKAQLAHAFKEKGIDKYWKIETYREFEFTKDLIQQLQSEKNLYSVIALVIIIVACTNIISMLIILVNDKKQEIGILRSMGATSMSIATIFGLCGIVIGVFGSLLGVTTALITLANLNTLVSWVSRMQGFDMFNAAYYGELLPQEVSYDALTFVLGATVIISLLAGIVPAVKASLLRPSAILKSE